jgi:hypothetical protein
LLSIELICKIPAAALQRWVWCAISCCHGDITTATVCRITKIVLLGAIGAAAIHNVAADAAAPASAPEVGPISSTSSEVEGMGYTAHAGKDYIPSEEKSETEVCSTMGCSGQRLR